MLHRKRRSDQRHNYYAHLNKCSAFNGPEHAILWLPFLLSTSLPFQAPNTEAQLASWLLHMSQYKCLLYNPERGGSTAYLCSPLSEAHVLHVEWGSQVLAHDAISLCHCHSASSGWGLLLLDPVQTAAAIVQTSARHIHKLSNSCVKEVSTCQDSSGVYFQNPAQLFLWTMSFHVSQHRKVTISNTLQ